MNIKISILMMICFKYFSFIKFKPWMASGIVEWGREERLRKDLLKDEQKIVPGPGAPRQRE